MNRRNILTALGIGAVATVSTDALVARAATIDATSLNSIDANRQQPMLPVNGPAKQEAIAEALEALAAELHLAASAQRARMVAAEKWRDRDRAQRALAAKEGRLHAPEETPRHTYMPGELWANELRVESSMKSDDWLGHKIIIDMEIYHSGTVAA
jgi:hypothetical protein